MSHHRPQRNLMRQAAPGWWHKPPRGATALALLAATLGVGLCPPAVAAQAPTLARFRGAERELCDLYMRVLEDGVDVFEPLWTDDPKIPNAGFFDFRKYPDWCNPPYATIIAIPGTGMVALNYAVLLTETRKSHFGKRRIPREVLMARIVKSLRWCALSSAYVDSPYEYLPATRRDLAFGKKWKRRLGWRADEIGYLTIAASTVWNHLDAETKKLFRAVATGGAARERLVRTWQPSGGGNHDQVKQDLSSTIGAAFLCPDDPDAKGCLDAVMGNSIDMVGTLQDRTNEAVAEGRPLKEWAKGHNLYQDYSSDHHAHANMWYGGDMLFEGRAYVDIIARQTGRRVPETFTYKGNGFDGVLEWLKTLCLASGGLAHPHGAEYDSYYGAGLLAFCYGATVKRDPVAAALEHRAAELLLRHSRAVKEYDYHRGSWAKAAMAYLMHKHHAPSAAPVPLDEALASLCGTAHYPEQRCFVHRTADKWVAFSWGSTSSRRPRQGFCGVVIPQRRLEKDADPPIYCHPHSLTGVCQAAKVGGEAGGRPKTTPRDCVYKFTRSDAAFSTAGFVTSGGVEQRQAFFSFAEGPCITLVAIVPRERPLASWSGLPLYSFVRPGLTRERTCAHEGGTAPVADVGRAESAWWCVNDRLGAIAIGGTGGIHGGRAMGYNWARKAGYRDKGDYVAISPVDGDEVNACHPVVEAGAALYVERPAHEIRAFAQHVLDLSAQLPLGWRSVVAPTGHGGAPRVLALANLSEHDGTASVSLSFPEGAPVLAQPTTITGSQARADVTLAALETSGQTLDWYVEAPPNTTIVARKTAFDRIELRAGGGRRGRVRIAYLGKRAARFVFRSAASATAESVRSPRPGRSRSLEWDLREPLVVQAVGRELTDTLAPAVEVATLERQADGKLRVGIRAADRSGIRSVRLTHNGRLVGERSTPPFQWTCEAKAGWHTFRAQATDASPHANTATSWHRTIQVK